MIDSILAGYNLSAGKKIGVKTAISVGIIALAVLLPQVIHFISGAPGGVEWLPMYLPVLLGGCVLGYKWGLGIGILSPLVSFLITSLTGNAMPAAARLPFMIVELAVFASVSGLFSKSIAKNGWMAFPAVLLAQVSGRMVFLALVAIFQNITPFTFDMIWAQVKTGLLGMVVQAVFVPFIVMLFTLLIKKDRE
ncbi:MAG: hypothetical protein J6N93_07375 [Clostridia bacterium]|nr:hypothetical protein [Clostridia bacterium]